MQEIHIYVKEIQGQYRVVGLIPGKDLFDLGGRSDPQEAVRHALDYARLLGVREDSVHLFGKTVTEWLATGMGEVVFGGQACCSKEERAAF